jgi:hypothetical protein
MKGGTMFLNRKLTQRKCGFKNIVPTAQFQDLGELDRFLMMDLGSSPSIESCFDKLSMTLKFSINSLQNL